MTNQPYAQSGALDKNLRAYLSKLPLKERVAAELRQAILSGELPPGSRVPSETELMDRFGVSRATVRQAVAILRSEGLIYTQHGRASFVRGTTPADTFTLPRHAPGDETGAGDGAAWIPAEDPSRYQVNATADLAHTLNLPENEPLWVFDRLLVHQPTGRRMLHRLYLPFATCLEAPALEHDPFRTPAELYAILTQAGHELSWREHVRARMPLPDDAAALRIPEGIPLLIAQRITLGTDGRPLALEETRLSADAAQLAYELPGPATTSRRSTRRNRR